MTNRRSLCKNQIEMRVKEPRNRRTHDPANLGRDEGWSRDVSDDVADELRERCAQRGAVPDFLLDFLEAHDTDRPIQLPLPMAI